MASSPDSSSTVDRRQRPVSTNQTSASARARTSPRPIFPQPDDPGSASTRDEPSSSLDRPRPTLPRVVVPTFPERNRPQGQRNADADPPSPRHRMTKRQRKGITAKENLHWLKMQDSQPDLSNRALAKLAKVQPCQIRDWKKMRERLEVSSSCRRRLMGAGRKSKFPFMERAVYRQFLKHRGRGLTVLVSMLQKWSAKYMKHQMPGPLDVSINRAFKCGVRHRYTGWFEEEGINTTTKSVLDDVNDLVDDELVVSPFYVEVPMPAEELQAAAEEADAAEEDAEAAAAKEEGGVLEEGGEAEEPSDDEWWRPGRFDGEDCEEWHAGDDSE
ncbi:unnamed protein product [Closterium sp. NIES-65]|nr:unnamed protein product [Closterium sp. NIES-65]